jgi:4-amino-4-deoxy-L-arabinose transferase-like glycosyltransferase
LTRKQWWLLVAAAVAVGLAIRIGFVLVRPHMVAVGDARNYLGEANLMARGKGWIDPSAYSQGITEQTAKYPPLYPLLLTICSLFFHSFFAHRIWSCLLSTVGVGLCAVLGRDLAGPTVGVLAAFGYAVYPNLWMSPGLGMSETVSPVLVLVVLVITYRAWSGPSWPRVAALGISLGFAALARDELILLAPLILLPIAWVAPRVSRARVLALGVAGVAVVVVPWIAYNSARFGRPVAITDSLGLSLSVGNCDQTYEGRLAGYWSNSCQVLAPLTEPEPQVYGADQERALHYVGSHLDRLPLVGAERVGRTLGFYEPIDQIDLDTFLEERPHAGVVIGLGMYYLLLAASIPGALVLRRRGVRLWPLACVAIDVVVASMAIYGDTRFRATLEPVLVLLSAVAVVESVRWARRRGPTDPGPARAASRAPSDPSSDSVSVARRRAEGVFAGWNSLSANRWRRPWGIRARPAAR